MNDENFCKSCGVAVPHNSHCPLCGRFIRETESAERFPEASDKTAGTKKIMRFIFIVTGIVLLFIDLIMPDFRGWSVIACAVLCLIWFTFFKPFFDSKPFGLFILYDVLLVWLTSLLIDIMSGYLQWSLAYVWPSAIIAGITVILFSSIIGRLKWSVIGTPLIIMTVLSAAMLVAGYCGLYTYMRLWFISALYSAISLFGLKYFLKRAFNEEMSRIFHI
jgi:predicted nucleic acid-binding Zn ribbon protein